MAGNGSTLTSRSCLFAKRWSMSSFPAICLLVRGGGLRGHRRSAVFLHANHRIAAAFSGEQAEFVVPPAELKGIRVEDGAVFFTKFEEPDGAVGQNLDFAVAGFSAGRVGAQGFAVASLEYRFSQEAIFPAQIEDCKSAIRWLRAHAAEHGIDPARIGAIGGSAGGTLATFLGATNGLAEFEGPAAASAPSSVVQAVVNIDGVANFLDNALIAQSEGPPSPYYVFQHGTYRTARTTWIAASPINYVGPGSAPTLFIKSTTLRPILPGRDEMSARLKLLGRDSAVVQFPETPHVFWLFHPWFDRVVEESDRFLRRHLFP